MVPTPAMVMFAIQAGVRLYSAGKKAYVEATLDVPLLLPLPSAPGINPASACTFFSSHDQGRAIAARPESGRIRTLVEAGSSGQLSSEGEKELTLIYQAYLRELQPEMFKLPASPDEPKGHEFVAILTVRQWSRGELGEHPTALQRIAGTLVNIAVDYFVQTPGAISEKRPSGRALKSFLEAIDELDFAEVPPAEIAGDLMIAIVDGVAAHPELIGNSETEQKFVRNIAQTLASSARTYLENVSTADRRNGSAWLQLIARAAVKGGLDTVLADPGTVLGVGESEANFIREIGGTFAELLIGPDKLRFQALLSGEGVNTVVRAALQATAHNPGILRVDNQGVRAIIVGVADGLSRQPNLITADIFPELARLVLEQTADNLELVWPKGSSDPAQHLLVTGLRQLFTALAAGTAASGGPTLTKGQLLGIAETVLAELVENPDWLLQRAELGKDTALGVAVRAALAALQQLGPQRLSADGVAAVITASLSAVAQRRELLDKLPKGGADAGKVALQAAIEAVVACAWGDQVTAGEKWQRARNSTLVAAVGVALATLAKVGAAQPQIDVLRREIGPLVDQRLASEMLAARLETVLLAA